MFARVIETPWYTGECRATSCLSCSATLSKQFPRFHSNYTANVVFQGQDMHAFFIHHHKQARNERKRFRRYRSSWLKKCMWVSRGIALYPQNGGQAAVVDAWAVHGIWWILVSLWWSWVVVIPMDWQKRANRSVGLHLLPGSATESLTFFNSNFWRVVLTAWKKCAPFCADWPHPYFKMVNENTLQKLFPFY